MSNIRRAATAAACTAGLALGAIAMASPASAATKTYASCSDGSTNVFTDWTLSGGSLTITSDKQTPQALAVGQIWTVVNGTTVANTSAFNAGDEVELGPKAVTGTVTPPGTLTLFVSTPAGVVTVTCT